MVGVRFKASVEGGLDDSSVFAELALERNVTIDFGRSCRPFGGDRPQTRGPRRRKRTAAGKNRHTGEAPRVVDPSLNQLPTCQSRHESRRGILRAGIKLCRQRGRPRFRIYAYANSCVVPLAIEGVLAPLTRRRECRQAKHRNRPNHIERSLLSPRRLQAP